MCEGVPPCPDPTISSCCLLGGQNTQFPVKCNAGETVFWFHRGNSQLRNNEWSSCIPAASVIFAFESFCLLLPITVCISAFELWEVQIYLQSNGRARVTAAFKSQTVHITVWKYNLTVVRMYLEQAGIN